MTKRLTLLAAIALVLAACGGGEAIDVGDPWARTSAMMQSAGAVYMDLTAEEADALVSASVDESVAAVVELHETMGGDMGDADDMEGEGEGDGMMSMSPVDRIDLPAGETVSLEPGGFHIMLLDLAEPLATGETFEVTLEFDSGESRTVEVEVRDN